MLIAQISDTHILARASEYPAAQLRADCLRDCVADINLQRPDAVIFTGDTVQHGQPDEYARLRDLLAPLQAPLYMIPGNRDDKSALRRVFDDIPFPSDGEFLHYTVEGHDHRLVAIDSTSPGERKGVFCAERQAWLEKTLSDQPDRATLLFIHHPPFDIDDHYIGGYRRPEEAAALEAVVSRHSQVEAMLCGHVHCPVRRDWAGTLASVMPSVAVDVRKGVDEAEAREAPIYMLHRLSDATGIVSDTRMIR
ncbi:MAG: phosphodiesterase [Gammaproteobacteria bacterium]|nr:phosphodiesterase [Gammaproteobacteria bacterium]MDH3433554.1 phosphodiesterase [Gammaproteobacteria bacterium]